MGTDEKQSLPRYSRAEHLDDDWQPTERDLKIVEAVFAFDQLLADYQIQRLFKLGKTQGELRCRLLYQHHYLNRFNRKQRAGYDFMAYWGDRRGAEVVAAQWGMTVKELRFRPKPKTNWIVHDVKVNDVRLDVMEACARYPQYVLENWIVQGAFWKKPDDRVSYADLTGKTLTHGMRPDGLFAVKDEVSRYRWRFLLEVDNNTEDNERIGREKILAGLAYLQSDVYRRRASIPPDKPPGGRWLLVTTSERRMHSMKARAEDILRMYVAMLFKQKQYARPDADKRKEEQFLKCASAFLFSTFDAVQPATVLTAPIWYRGGEQTPRMLLEK